MNTSEPTVPPVDQVPTGGGLGAPGAGSFGDEVARLASIAFGSLLHAGVSVPNVGAPPTAGLLERPTLPHMNGIERSPWESPQALLGDALSLVAPAALHWSKEPSAADSASSAASSPSVPAGATDPIVQPSAGLPSSSFPSANFVAVPSPTNTTMPSSALIPGDAVPAGGISEVTGRSAPNVAGASAPSSSGAALDPAVTKDPARGQLDPFVIDLGAIDFEPRGQVPQLKAPAGPFDAEAVRRDFPIQQQRIHGKRLVWLDNAATTQKPQVVIDRLATFYERENSNVHRAAHTLAGRATDAYEGARATVRRFLNAPASENIVFTRGATEAINLVAKSWGARHVEQGDEILITWLEHHANIVPWQQLATQTGARLRVAPVDDRGQVILEEFERLLGPRTRLVAFTQVSNALGTITPAREMVQMAHRHGAKVLVDGAQSVSHLRVDVQSLDCDWFCFSGHKVFAPTGIGALYGKSDVLADSPPWQGGGNMIVDVTFERTVVHPPPWRFEAGTGNIADAAGLGAALDYVSALGLENIARHEHDLLLYGTEELKRVPGLKLIGTAKDKAGVLSFVIDGLRTEDLSAALDQEGIAVRSGHHCAQPILRRFGVESTVRASLAPYNTCDDIDTLVDALLRLTLGSAHPAR